VAKLLEKLERQDREKKERQQREEAERRQQATVLPEIQAGALRLHAKRKHGLRVQRLSRLQQRRRKLRMVR